MRGALAIALFLGGVAAADEIPLPDQIQALAKPGLFRCTEKIAAVDFRQVNGVVPLVITVGTPPKVKVGKHKVNKALVACAAQVFQKLSYPAALAPGDTVEIPLTFEPAPSVTVRTDDVPGMQLGPKVIGQAILTERSALAKQGTLWRIVVEPGATFTGNSLSGAAVVPISGTTRVGDTMVAAADAIAYPPVTPIRLRAEGSEPLELLVVYGPQQSAGVRVCMKGAPCPAPLVIAAKQRPASKLPSGVAWVMLTGPEALGGIAATLLRLDSKGSVPEHAHAAEAEILFCLRGAGVLTIEGDQLTVEPGTAVHVWPGAKHAFTVTSPEAFEAIQFYAPAGPERRFLGATP